MRRVTILSIIFIFIVLIGEVYASYSEPIDSCRVLDKAGEYYLTKNITPASGNCFVINISNVVIDCRGHSVSNSSHIAAGFFAEDKSNITIKNCEISIGGSYQKPGYGIRFEDVVDSFILGNEIKDVYTGIYLGGDNVKTKNIIVNNLVVNRSRQYALDVEVCKNCSLSDIFIESYNFTGMYLNSPYFNNNRVFNVHINHTGGLAAIALEHGAKYNIFDNITLTGKGFFLGGANYNTLSNIHGNLIKGYFIDVSYSRNNTFMNLSSTLASDYFVFVEESSLYNYFYSLYSNYSLGGIKLYSGSNHSIFENVRLENIDNKNRGAIIALGDSSNNILKDFIIKNSSVNTVYFIRDKLFNNHFENISIQGGMEDVYDLYSLDAQLFNASFFDVSLGRYWFPKGINSALFGKSLCGSILFREAINGTGSNLSSEVEIKFNKAFINESNRGLNKSAQITLYGLPTNMSNPKIMRNGLVCNGCMNLTSLNAGEVVFNVPSGGEYSIRDSTPTNCNGADINRDGAVNFSDLFILNQNYNKACGSANNWCNMSDINRDGMCSFSDLLILSQNYNRFNCMV